MQCQQHKASWKKAGSKRPVHAQAVPFWGLAAGTPVLFVAGVQMLVVKGVVHSCTA